MCFCRYCIYLIKKCPSSFASHKVKRKFQIETNHSTYSYVRPRTELRSGSVSSGRTTINLASEQVSDLYSVSFKRSDSVRALTYKRLPTVLIYFSYGGARDEVSQ